MTIVNRSAVRTIVAASLSVVAGCLPLRQDKNPFVACEEPIVPANCGPAQLEIDEACRTGCLAEEPVIPPSPEAVGSNQEVAYWDLSLDEAISIALQQSEVMRDFGGTVIRTPDAIRSVQDPAIVYTDPRFGEEAALSYFDATFAASALFDKNDRVFNNTFFGTNGILAQDLNTYNVAVQKRAATGGQMTLRHITEYDFNNQLGNRFGTPSGSWQTYFDAEVRQPLLQGAGLQFNRIAGPSNDPGVINGVLLARVRADVSLADFESGVRDLVSNVENAYWDLYFAYMDLDSKKAARDQAYGVYKSTDNLVSAPGASSLNQSDIDQSKEQFWRFESDVRDALNGRLLNRTAANNGSGGGTFFNPGGVRVAERRLRLILGLPVNSLQLIRPSTYPAIAPVKFDWENCAAESLNQRPELRRQRWQVKRRELELLASRNFLSPRLDVVGRYRWRGFGQDLISQSSQQFSSAWGNLADGNNDEWQLGVEMDMPIGFRRGHASVRNAELNLAREKAVLREQERAVMYGLSNAFGEVQRAFEVLSAQWNRRDASSHQVETLLGLMEKSKNVDILLEAQRRLVQSNIDYHAASVEYALAIKNVHYEKGTLLNYNNITLAESASDSAAYANMRKRNPMLGPDLDYVCRSVPVSPGKKPAAVLSGDATELPAGAVIVDEPVAEAIESAEPLATPAPTVNAAPPTQ